MHQLAVATERRITKHPDSVVFPITGSLKPQVVWAQLGSSGPVGLARSAQWVSLLCMCSFWGPREQPAREEPPRALATVQRSLLMLIRVGS